MARFRKKETNMNVPVTLKQSASREETFPRSPQYRGESPQTTNDAKAPIKPVMGFLFFNSCIIGYSLLKSRDSGYLFNKTVIFRNETVPSELFNSLSGTLNCFFKG